jgi:predicted site-specific integrase-resolvase
MYTVSVLAKSIAVSPITLARWRLEGHGPQYIKAGRRVLYDPSDVASWLASNRRQSTSEIVGGRANG